MHRTTVRRTGVGVLLGLLMALSWGCRSQPSGPTDGTTPASTLEPSVTRRPTQAPATPTPAPKSPTPKPTNTAAPTHTPTPNPWAADLPEECPSAASGEVVLSSEAPGRGVDGIFAGQIRDYLNARGSAAGLAAALSALPWINGNWQARPQVQTVDVTGNSTPEVLVELTFFEPFQYSEGALFVYRCAGGEFAGGSVMVTAGQVPFADDPDGIRAIRDMNKDGIPEIVHSHVVVAGTHAYFIREFHILEWNGQEFIDLIPEDENGFTAQADTGDGVIRDRDGDGTLELIISGGLGESYPELGPQRARTDIWQWDGAAFTLARWEFTKPVFRIHAIWDGDDATLFGEYDRALAFYQDAVFNEQLIGWSQGRMWPDSWYGGQPTPTPEPAERPRLSAYGRYRIMLLHVVRESEFEAEVVYDTLQTTFPEGTIGNQYAQLATAFWEEYSASGDLTLACGKAVEFAKTHAAGVLSALGKDFYGIGQREYLPEDICPFPRGP